MIPTTQTPVAAANLCTGHIPFDQAVIACAIVTILAVVVTVLAYGVGVWLRR